MSPKKSPLRLLLVLFLALAMAAAACGSDDVTDIETTDPAQSQPADDDADGESNGDDGGDGADLDGTDDLPEGPIPVEPDGGIGDGAEPLPGAEEPVDEGSWHGAIVAETNCPGTTWKRVQADAFSFSVPEDFSEVAVQPIDSEVGVWSNGTVEVTYDYGWYSGSVSGTEGAEVIPIDYSGFVGEQAVIRTSETDAATNMVGVYFGELVADDADQWNKLSMLVTHEDPNDEIIGRCIVGSIDWNFSLG